MKAEGKKRNAKVASGFGMALPLAAN